MPMCVASTVCVEFHDGVGVIDEPYFMMKLSDIFSRSRFAVVGGLSAVICSLVIAQSDQSPQANQPASDVAGRIAISSEPPLRTGALGGYSDIVDKVSPSVVSITAARVERGYVRNPRNGRVEMREFSSPAGLGSGVIVTSDGIVVTNNHVIDGANSVQVHLTNRKEPVSAKVLGRDAATDLAVLKVDAVDLPAVTFADCDNAKPGDIVLAIGSPFGLKQSVTSGIISALGRSNLGIVASGEGYEDFIQTDAAINPGNSGGALIDNRGRVIGINTAILSRTGGSVGIGLAIPTDIVVDVIEQIVETGEIRRGFVGIGMTDVSAEIAKEFGLKKDTGVLVTQVVKGSPAFEAGMQPGDIVEGIEGTEVMDTSKLRLEIGRKRPGEELHLKIDRFGEELALDVKTTEREAVWAQNQRRLRVSR